MKCVILLVVSVLICSCERKEQVQVEIKQKKTTIKKVSPPSSGASQDSFKELFEQEKMRRIEQKRAKEKGIQNKESNISKDSPPFITTEIEIKTHEPSTSKPTLKSKVNQSPSSPSGSMKKALEEIGDPSEVILIDKPEIGKKEGKIVSIDAEKILDIEKVKDHEFCADHYPEIYYLTLKGYKGSGLIAFKAACSLAKTDANYYEEIASLITHAYYQSFDDFTVWSDLEDEEKKILYKLLDDYSPIDWESEKAKYKVEAK